MDKAQVLDVSKVHKYFPGVHAVDDVSFRLNAGEVLGVVGENGAGKSTLMNILLGSIKPDEGIMQFESRPYAPKRPHDALTMGISMIHQELCLVPSVSVSENIWIGRESLFMKAGFVSTQARNQKTSELFRKYDVSINPQANVGGLSVANQQLTELFRAISYNSKIIIMDEPTSSLTEVEIKILYKVIRQLTLEGTAILYISHKLDEIMELCNRVVVMRDGRLVAERSIKKVDENALVSLMVGRDISDQFPKEDIPLGEVIFEARHLSKPKQYNDVSFYAREGEIVGFCGLIGAGRTEIMNGIFGIDPPDSGELFLHGDKLDNKNVKSAISNHIAMVNEDRRNYGIIPMLSSKANLTVATMDRVFRLGFEEQKTENRIADDMIQSLHIKVSSREQIVGTLSGGNQQKVIIGRWLLTNPDILILDEPTRGIDVGAKTEIYKLMGKLASEKKAILLVSSELNELMGVCDRIYVVHRGEIAAEVCREQFDEDTIMQYAFGLKRQEKVGGISEK